MPFSLLYTFVVIGFKVFITSDPKYHVMVINYFPAKSVEGQKNTISHFMMICELDNECYI